MRARPTEPHYIQLSARSGTFRTSSKFQIRCPRPRKFFNSCKNKSPAAKNKSPRSTLRTLITSPRSAPANPKSRSSNTKSKKSATPSPIYMKIALPQLRLPPRRMSNKHPTTYPRRPHTQFKTIFHLSNPNKIAVKIPNRLRHKKLKHELSPNLPRTQRELSPNRAELSPSTPRTTPNQPKLKPNQSRRHPVHPPRRRRPLRPPAINRSTTIPRPTSNPPTKPI